MTRSRAGLAALAALVLGLNLALTNPAAANPAATNPAAANPARHGLPGSFQWRSSDILVSPKPDATHPIVSVKDPTVVRYRGQWLVYATTANTSGNWSLEYLSFRDWKDAGAATPYYLDTNPNIGTGYRAAPQLFY